MKVSNAVVIDVVIVVVVVVLVFDVRCAALKRERFL